MRYLMSILLCLAALLPLKAQNNALATQNAAQTARAEVLLETTEGNIRIALYNETPRHRDNFLKLVESHFYDSLLFHRVIPSFMIQTGDPDSRHAEPGTLLGEGDLPYQLEPEIVPALRHRYGSVAAAREGDDVNPGHLSSACQFYIVTRKSGTPHLDGAYTVFGEVTEGMDVANRIQRHIRDDDDRPVHDVRILRATVVRK
jgi:peptidyl-prolyl cis-trans isomerase B (cyclophilin B)